MLVDERGSIVLGARMVGVSGEAVSACVSFSLAGMSRGAEVSPEVVIGHVLCIHDAQLLLNSRQS